MRCFPVVVHAGLQDEDDEDEGESAAGSPRCEHSSTHDTHSDGVLEDGDTDAPCTVTGVARSSTSTLPTVPDADPDAAAAAAAGLSLS